MVIEIALGVDLERDVLAKADIPLLVSPDLRFVRPHCSGRNRWD